MNLNDLTLLKVDLSLFEGEGGGGEAGAPGENAPAAGEQSGENLQQQSDADAAAAERTRAYNDFIQQNKDLDDARIQKLVKGRLKASSDQIQTLKQSVDSYQPLLDRLQTKYGTADVSELITAMDSDATLWEDEADKHGMTTDQYMQFQQLQLNNQQLIRQEQLRQEQEANQQQINAWLEQADQVKTMYPEFDLETELQNEGFASLIQKGIPMEHAYKLLHMDELMSQATMQTAARTEKAITDNIRANGMRPAENGTRGQSAFTTTTDVKNLTAEDMDDLIRRARNGELITLKQS